MAEKDGPPRRECGEGAAPGEKGFRIQALLIQQLLRTGILPGDG